MKRLWIIACLIMVATGCVGTPSYKAETYSFTSTHEGYSDRLIPIKKNIQGAVVKYSSTESTDPGVTRRYLLFRCAELSKQEGAEFFAIVELNDETVIHMGMGSRIPRFTATIAFIGKEQANDWEKQDYEKLSPHLIRINGIYETKEVLTSLETLVRR